MEQYKQEFIEFMIDCQVLKFGDFVTKSGRKTPFFVNTGFYHLEPDRGAASEAGRVLCESDSRSFRA